MEPTLPPPVPEPDGPPVAAGGELVVMNGRLTGARRPLNVPLTVIGRAASCDIRLNVDDVDPVHCAVIHCAEGLQVRDLHSTTGMQVNGQPAAHCRLHDGDTLRVGPFYFKLSLPGDGKALTVCDRDALAREQEALRIQAAAVVAQQASLTEEEIRQQQRRLTLERQEEQLATHLEEKRLRLTELHKQVRMGRLALQKKQAKQERRNAAITRDLEKVRQHGKTDAERLQVERQRLGELRRRLKQRWHKHWSLHEESLQRREDEVASQWRELEKQNERLEREKATVAQLKLRCNGDVELGRRELQAGWEALRQAKHQHAAGEADLSSRRQAVEERAAALLDSERDLEEQSQEWASRRSRLEKEVEGLESRIRNHRRKIIELQECLPAALSEEQLPVSATESAISRGGSSNPPPGWPERIAELEKLSGDLADQRLHLVEQCQRLVQSQECWQRDRDTAAAELESLAVRLQGREHALVAHEQALTAEEFVLRQRQDEVAQIRRHLDGWQARLTAREVAWEGERDGLLTRLQTRQKLADGERAALSELRLRWTEGRRQELDRLRAERTWCEGLRQECAVLREEWFRRGELLELEQRRLAEQALAMEQLRLESIGVAPDSAAAEKRLDRLQRDWEKLYAESEHNIARERRALEAETARLEERSQRLQQQAAEYVMREAEFSGRQSTWEHEQALAEAARAELRQELQIRQVQCKQYERQLDDLRDEVERMARLLLDENDGTTTPIARAA